MTREERAGQLFDLLGGRVGELQRVAPDSHLDRGGGTARKPGLDNTDHSLHRHWRQGNHEGASGGGIDGLGARWDVVLADRPYVLDVQLQQRAAQLVREMGELLGVNVRGGLDRQCLTLGQPPSCRIVTHTMPPWGDRTSCGQCWRSGYRLHLTSVPDRRTASPEPWFQESGGGRHQYAQLPT